MMFSNISLLANFLDQVVSQGDIYKTMKSLKLDKEDNAPNQDPIHRSSFGQATNHYRTENTGGHDEGNNLEEYIKKVNQGQSI